MGLPKGGTFPPCHICTGTPQVPTQSSLLVQQALFCSTTLALSSDGMPSHALSRPLCLTGSTELQVQLKFHSFQGNLPSYLLLSLNKILRSLCSSAIWLIFLPRHQSFEYTLPCTSCFSSLSRAGTHFKAGRTCRILYLTGP